MRYCKFNNNQLVPEQQFRNICQALLSLFSRNDFSLVAINKQSLQLLYDKSRKPDLPLDWTRPIEIEALKEKGLINEDNELNPYVNEVVNYIIGLNANGVPELLDKPIFEVDIL